MLGFYGLCDWQVLRVRSTSTICMSRIESNKQYIQVQDTSPAATSLTGQFTDTSQVEKFELTEEEYASRRGTYDIHTSYSDANHINTTDTLLSYKKAHKIGRFAPADESSPPEQPQEINIPLNSRCEVSSSELPKRGTVRYVGQTSFGAEGGVWVGVEYDEPLGKNDGSYVSSMLKELIN